MKKGLSLFLLVFCVGVAATGWWFLYRTRNVVTELMTPPMPSPTAVLPPEKLKPADTTARVIAKSVDSIAQESREDFRHQQFDVLEKEMIAALKDRQRLTGGYYRSYAIQQGLSSPNYEQNATENEWQQHFARFSAWIEKYPRSFNPHLLMAAAWINYAWVARGDGMANTISKASFDLFEARLRKSLDELNEAGELGGKETAEWHREMVDVGALLGMDSKIIDGYLEQGLKLDPSYYPIVNIRAHYLLPKWGGKPGDVERFVIDLANRIEGDEGKIVYFETVSVLRSELGSRIFSTGLAWPKAKEGYELLRPKYGVDDYRKNMAMGLALSGGDMASASAYLDDVGDKWDPTVWGSKDVFDTMKSGIVMYRNSPTGVPGVPAPQKAL